MNQTFGFDHSKRILLLASWCMMIGLFMVVSHIETIPYQEALNSIESPSYQLSTSSFDLTNYFERQAYEQVLQRYQFRVMRTLIIAGIGVFGLFSIFRQRKISINEEAISVYSMFRKKPMENIEWKDVAHIHIGHGKGIRGITGDQGLYIKQPNKYDGFETTFVSLKYIKKNEVLIEMIQKLNHQSWEVTIDDESIIQPKGLSIKMILSTAINTYKQCYKNIVVFSGIIISFAILQRFYATSQVNMIASVANIYFGYRATIGLNYYLYHHYNGEQLTFDRSWAYGQSQYGRFFGAEFIKSIGILLAIGGSVLIAVTELQLLLKGLMIVFCVIVGFAFYSRMYLLPYIASIIDVKSSYMVINAFLWRNYSRAIILLSFINLLPIVVMILYIAVNHVTLNTTINLVEKTTYLLIGVNFLLMPFEACCSMFLLKKLPEKLETENLGVSTNEEIA